MKHSTKDTTQRSRSTQPRRPLRKTLGAVLAGSALWAVSAHATPLPDEYLAKYRFTEKQSEIEALRKELDRVAEKFNPFIRSIARKKLHERIHPYEQLNFDRNRGAPRVHLGPNTVLPCDGKWHEVVGDRNEKGKGVCTFDGTRLSTHTEYDRAVRKNTMTFSKEGQQIHMEARLESPKLPDDIEFELTYERH